QLVDGAYRERLLGRVLTAAADPLDSAGSIHDAWRSHGAAKAGANAQPHLREAEAARCGRDTVVGCQAQLEAPAQRHAIDDADRGDGKILDSGENSVAAPGPALQFNGRH